MRAARCRLRIARVEPVSTHVLDGLDDRGGLTVEHSTVEVGEKPVAGANPERRVVRGSDMADLNDRESGRRALVED